MMSRLEKYQYIIKSSSASKSLLFLSKPSEVKLNLVAGLYKTGSISPEHGLILSSIAGILPITKSQLHGKRQKRTVSLNSELRGAVVWPCLDKIIHELIPRVSDFRTPKFKKPATGSYTLKIRQKITPLADFADLVTPEMFDSYRGVFLPLAIHISLDKDLPHLIAEQSIRQLRLPMHFYARWNPPAFDDLAVFEQNF